MPEEKKLFPSEDRGQTDRTAGEPHTRWTPSLPQASVAPRCTPRRASAQLMT